MCLRLSKHCNVGTDEAKALCLTDSRALAGHIVLLQTSEESNDGSLLVALFSLHPVMAPFPGLGVLRNDAKIYESTDLTVPETRDIIILTVQEQENPFCLCCTDTRRTTVATIMAGIHVTHLPNIVRPRGDPHPWGFCQEGCLQ